MRPQLCVALLVGGLVSACVEAETPPRDEQPSVETRNFRFYNITEEPAWFQHQYDILSARFGFALPDGKKIILRSFTRPETCSLESYCDGPEGFEIDWRLYWRTEPRLYWLGELYADLIGSGPLFLRAGLAEVLTGGATIPECAQASSNRGEDIASLLDDRVFESVWPHAQGPLRATAGDFVRFLIDRMGAREFAELYRTWDRSEPGFKAHVGEALDETVEAWRASPAYEGRRYAWKEPECRLGPLPRVDELSSSSLFDTWKGFHPLFYCEGVLNYYRRGAAVVELPEAGEVEVMVRAPAELDNDFQADVHASLESCEGPRGPDPLFTPSWRYEAGPLAFVPLSSPERRTRGYLPAGRYVVTGWISDDLWTPVELTVRLAPREPPVEPGLTDRPLELVSQPDFVVGPIPEVLDGEPNGTD